MQIVDDDEPERIATFRCGIESAGPQAK